MERILCLLLCYLAIVLPFKTGLSFEAGRSYKCALPPLASGNMDEGSMVGLTSFTEDAQWLGKSVTQWLDIEWIRQPVHSRIGAACSDLYMKGRQTGINDLGEMLMEIGTGLESVSFDDPEGDAYVNAWDVANKCSDLLMLRMENDLCDCMGDMSMFQVKDERILDADRMEELTSDLSSTFQRYKWMARFLDDEEDMVDAAIVLGLVLGYRAGGGEVDFDENKSAYGWQDECKNALPMYSMLDSQDVAMATRLQRDLPEDDEVTDVAVEPLVGIEMYKQMRCRDRGATEWDLRRVLLAKWLYVHGFMTEEAFPPLNTYLPANMAEGDGEDEEEED
jgi:hypothetical protein